MFDYRTDVYSTVTFQPHLLRLQLTVADVIEQCRSVLPAIEVRQNARTIQTRALDHGPLEQLTLADDSGSLSDGEAIAEFALHETVFQLRGSLTSSSSGAYFRPPFALYNMNRRQVNRTELAPGAASLRFSVMVDGVPHLRTAHVLDLGVDGVQVWHADDGGVLPEQAEFPALLELQGQRIACLARLRHRANASGAETWGLRIATRNQRDVLVEAYLRQRFPRVVDRRDVDGRRVAELFDRSGYLALRDGTAPSEAWLSEENTDGVSRAFCYRDEAGELVGHISFTRSYSKAWLGHQIATLRDHPDAVACRRALYLLITTYATLLDGDDTCVYGFFDLGKRWHQTFFCGFCDWVNDPTSVVIVSLDRFERSTTDPAHHFELPPDCAIGAPEPEDMITATALIRAQLPALVANSFDIHPASLASDALHPAYRGLPEGRARQVFVLKVQGQLAAVALCETGPRSASLFNLMNMAQFYLRTDEHAPSVAAQLALLSRVREYYRERGDEIPIIVAPPGTFAAQQEPGTVLAETMGLIAKSGRSMRQYESFIRYQFSKYMHARD